MLVVWLLVNLFGYLVVWLFGCFIVCLVFCLLSWLLVWLPCLLVVFSAGVLALRFVVWLFDGLSGCVVG